MNKRIYQKPTIECEDCQMENSLLAGSGHVTDVFMDFGNDAVIDDAADARIQNFWIDEDLTVFLTE